MDSRTAQRTKTELAEKFREHWVAPAWREAGKVDALMPRRNGLNHPLPCYCLKVPTGGGKTLLAVKVIDLVNHHFRLKSTGLELWVVPTTQIYKDPTPLFALDLRQTGRRDLKLKAGLDVEPLFEDPDADGLPVEDGVIDLYFAASHLKDVVPNPWRAAGLAKDVFDELLEKHSQDRVGANYLFVLEELRKELSLQRDTLCQEAFRQLLASGEMRFIVAAKDLGFNKLPTKIETVITRQANRDDGKPFQANLFSEMDES